jgi:hypothetical protein
MNTIMNDDDIKTLPQVRAFLDGTRAVEFSLHTRSERYDFVRRTLIRLAYHALSKPDKGVVLSFLVSTSHPERVGSAHRFCDADRIVCIAIRYADRVGSQFWLGCESCRSNDSILI